MFFFGNLPDISLNHHSIFFINEQALGDITQPLAINHSFSDSLLAHRTEEACTPHIQGGLQVILDLYLHSDSHAYRPKEITITFP